MLGLGFCILSHTGDNNSSQNLLLSVKDKSFASFNLGLSHDEIQKLQNLTINKRSSMNNYGHFDTLESEIVGLLRSLGNNEEDAQVASKIIYNIIIHDVSLCDCQTAWVLLRAFVPNELYDVPRWHTDGVYYRSEGNCCYKLVYALQGPSTLFLELPDQIRTDFFKIQNKTFAGMTSAEIKSLSRRQLDDLRLGDRIKLAELVADFYVHEAPANVGTIFATGNPVRAAIHSEPPIHENRLFMSIVPGTYEQIQEWYAKEHPDKK